MNATGYQYRNSPELWIGLALIAAAAILAATSGCASIKTSGNYCIDEPMPVTEFRFIIMSDNTVRMIPKGN